MARGTIYKCLSIGYSPVTGDVKEFLAAELEPKLTHALRFLPPGYDLARPVALVVKVAKAGEGLEGEYNRLFRNRPVCTPYETERDLRAAPAKGQVLADILGFYEAFGLKPSQCLKELPDHIGTELEFMAILLLKEAYARSKGTDEQVELCVDAQVKFLKDHLAPWATPFCHQVEKESRTPFYRAIAGLTRRFLRLETKHLSVGRLVMTKGLREGPGETDSSTCPFSGV